nr:MAG TPA: 4Fe-4S binding domain protein [Caudoviricetes sp.]
MTQLQEAIRDKITKYSDACGMCTDITKECDAYQNDTTTRSNPR